jgi:hypothetical protein
LSRATSSSTRSGSAGVPAPSVLAASSASAAGRLRGQEEHVIELAFAARLQHRKHGAERLADPGRRLGDQAAFVARRAIDGHGQLALPAAELPVRERQRAQRLIAGRTMRGLALGPADEARALFGEERGERLGAQRFRQHRFALGHDVEIDERDVDFGEAARRAHQMRIDLRLRPVQRAMVGRHRVEAAAVGLDLLEAVRDRVVAVRTPAHGQRAPRAGERDFGFVACAARRRDGAVAGDAFERGRRGREAQVEIAAPRGELAHRPHRDDVAHADSPAASACSTPAPAHSTSTTRTGMPCATQYASQRVWLSCSRSPGPFTSISS